MDSVDKKIISDIDKQIIVTKVKIKEIEQKIKQWTKEAISAETKKSKGVLLAEAISKQRKQLPELQLQLGQLEETLVACHVGQVGIATLDESKRDPRSTQQIIRDAAELRRNISNDPVQNPYFYSIHEQKPQYAAVAHKRADMRRRGKNPGPWTSNLEVHSRRSDVQEEGEDPILMSHQRRLQGAKKRNRGKKDKRSQKKKPKRSKSKPKRSVPKWI